MKNFAALLSILFSSFCFQANAQWNIVKQFDSVNYKLIGGYNEKIVCLPWYSFFNPYALKRASGDNFDFLKFADSIATGLQEIQFISNSIGYIAGGTPYGNWNLLLKTTDGGGAWSILNTPAVSPAYSIDNVHFIDDVTGYISDDNGNIYKTVDGGVNFTSFELPLSDKGNKFYIADLKFRNAMDGLVLLYTNVIQDSTREVAIYITHDGASSWQKAYYEQIESIKNYAFYIPIQLQLVNANIAFAMGNDGVFLKSSDGGETWSKPNSEFNESVTSFHFINPNYGFASVFNKIIETTDGGISWTASYQNDSLSLFNYELYFPNKSKGYAIATSSLFDNYNSYLLEIEVIDSTLSSDKNIKSQINIYPTLTKDLINLDYPYDLQVQRINLIDVTGRIIRTYAKNERIITVKGIKKGIYFLNIQLKGEIITEKIIIN